MVSREQWTGPRETEEMVAAVSKLYFLAGGYDRLGLDLCRRPGVLPLHFSPLRI